jgi:hypothetical protein
MTVGMVPSAILLSGCEDLAVRDTARSRVSAV